MPDSLLFVGLVLAWLVVLVPMLARHRQEVRRTADAALATRVLHRSGSRVRLVRRGPADGHRSDPQWQERQDQVVEDPVQDMAAQDTAGSAPDDAELEHASDDGAELRPRRSGRGGFDPHADAVARRARYAFRQRVASALVVAALVTLVGAVLGLSALWSPHLVVDLVLVGYLAFLRRQTRIEADVRERRLARMGRARLGVDTVEHEAGFGAVPARLRRPGAVVLEIDDEDPAFDELEGPLRYEEQELPRAAGQ